VPPVRRMYTCFGQSLRCVSLLCLPVVEIGAPNHLALNHMKLHHYAHIPEVGRTARHSVSHITRSDGPDTVTDGWYVDPPGYPA
jgi:hypothetical protein